MADLGISSYQIDTAERGFAIRFEAELDMRMNQAQEMSAKTLLNEYDEEAIANVLWKYGELRNSRPIARAIVQYRVNNALNTTGDLVKIVSKFSQRNKEMQFLAKVFQALRIEVNDEMGALNDMLEQSLDVLKPGGRLVVMSYHSLEDRPVKNFIKSGNFKGEIEKDFYGNQLTPFKMITRRAVVAQSEEVANNPRARSAKLRVAEKKEVESTKD